MTLDLEPVKAAATKALKHSGKGAWLAHERAVVGSIDLEGRKSFTVAEVDTHDELPLCAGEAIATFIEAAQPSVVLDLIAEIERLALVAGEGVARVEAFAMSMYAEHRASPVDEDPEDAVPCLGCGRAACTCNAPCANCGRPWDCDCDAGADEEANHV